MEETRQPAAINQKDKRMRLRKYKINGNEYEVEVNSYSGDRAKVTVNGTTYNVEICGQDPVVISPIDGSKTSVINKVVEAPLPGIITSVKVKVGDHVKAGQVVAILDAMKMENEILTEHDGVIASVDVVPDESVLEGSTIVTLH